MNRSVNVIGFSVDPQGLYVSLAPSKNEAIIVLSESTAPPKSTIVRPYIQKASGWVTRFETNGDGTRMDYKGFGKGKLELSGLQPNRPVALSGSGLNGSTRWVKPDEKGVLTIGNVKNGSIEITW
jgi:hypothetical protein